MTITKDKITIAPVTDTHTHPRWGPLTPVVIEHLHKGGIRRAFAEPNVGRDPVHAKRGLTTWQEAKEYAQFLAGYNPYLDLQLEVLIKMTRDLTPAHMREASDQGFFVYKLYFGVTTGSSGERSALRDFYPLFEEAQKINVSHTTSYARPIVIQIHCESPDPKIVIWEKEFAMLDQFADAVKEFPDAKFSFEHVSDRRTVQRIYELPDNTGGSLTPGHMQIFGNNLFYKSNAEGASHPALQPHNFCLPIAKTYDDLKWIRRAVAGGWKKFWLGSDTAPHLQKTKECAEGCAGLYYGEHVVEHVAEMLAEEKAEEMLEDFTSRNAEAFYGLQPLPFDDIELVRSPHQITERHEVPGTGDFVVPFMAGRERIWKVQ